MVTDPDDDKQKPETDVDALMRLALWARQHGFFIGDVTIGSLTLKIRDLRILAQEGLKGDLYQPTNVWQDAGLEDGAPAPDGTVA